MRIVCISAENSNKQASNKNFLHLLFEQLVVF